MNLIILDETEGHEQARASLTLRDYFAGQALAGYLADGATRSISRETGADRSTANLLLSEACYRAADAMLKERAK